MKTIIAKSLARNRRAVAGVALTNLHAVELHQVEYFLAVVDHNGINAAANALQLAQPTASQAIRA